MSENVGRFKGQAFWSGAVDLETGEVLRVWQYEIAQEADFHLDFYFTGGLDGRFHDGEVGFFCINDGELYGEAREGADLSPRIIARILDQVDIVAAGVETVERDTPVIPEVWALLT